MLAERVKERQEQKRQENSRRRAAVKANKYDAQLPSQAEPSQELLGEPSEDTDFTYETVFADVDTGAGVMMSDLSLYDQEENYL